jgi:hypothetical protein
MENSIFVNSLAYLLRDMEMRVVKCTMPIGHEEKLERSTGNNVS